MMMRVMCTMDQKLILSMLADTWLLSVHLYLYESHDEDEGHVYDRPEVDLVHVG
jgi:hypothetical protein